MRIGSAGGARKPGWNAAACRAALACLAALLACAPPARAQAPAPGNDAFASPTTLSSATSPLTGDNIGATAEAGEPFHAAGRTPSHSVWFRYVADTTRTVTLGTCGTDFYPVLAVYTGSALANLQQVATSVNPCTTPLSFAATSGTTYWIALSSYYGFETGGYTVRLDPGPRNDDRADAWYLEAGYDESGTNVNAGKEAQEPDHAGEPGGRSVWYELYPNRLAPHVIEVCGADFDTLLAVYRADGAEVAANDDSQSCADGSTRSLVRFTPADHEVHHVAVDGKGGAQGTFTVRVLDNDDVTGANWVGDGSRRTASNRHATKAPDEPAHAGNAGGASLWYLMDEEVEAGRRVTVDTCSAWDDGVDTLLAVYTQAGMTPLGSSDDAFGCGTGSRVSFVAPGGPVLIAVDGKNGATGRFTLRVEAAPPNDAQAAASEVFGSEVYDDNREATKEAGEPDHAGDPGGASVWYRWTPLSTATYEIDTCGSGFDTLLAVYRPGGSGLEEIAANDDAIQPADGGRACGVRRGDGCDSGYGGYGGYGGYAEPPPSGSGCTYRGSRLSLSVTAGTEYLIAVDGKAAEQGFLTLQFTGPPANDAFSGAEDFYSGVWGTTSRATAESGEPPHAGTAATRSVWYRLDAHSGTPVNIGLSTCNRSGAPVRLAVYRGETLATLQQVAASGPTLGCASGNGARVSWRRPGAVEETYWIAVDAAGDSDGEFSLYTESGPFNDDRANAMSLGSGGVYSGTTRMATMEAGEPDHAGTGLENSVWYRWTPFQSGGAAIDTCPSFTGAPTPDTALAVYRLAGEELVPLGANDDVAGCGDGRQSRVTWPATSGVTYYIAVVSRTGDAFSIRATPAAFNDNRSSAYWLSQFGGSIQTSNVAAGKEASEPDHAGQAGGGSLWFRLSAPATAQYTFDTCQSAIDTLLAVYTSSGTTLTPVAASDDEPGCGPAGTNGRVTFAGTEGTEYWIAVDGKGGAQGSITLAYPPFNDAFASAHALPDNAQVSGDLARATAEAAEPAHGGTAASRTAWFSWRPSRASVAVVDTCSFGGATPAVYTGSAVGALAPVETQGTACPSGQAGGRLTFRVDGTSTYRIAVDNKGSSGSASFQLKVRLGPPNDALADAIDLGSLSSSGIWRDGSTLGASREMSEPDHATGGGTASVWYRFTPTASGNVRFDTCSTFGFDSVLAVYTLMGSSVLGLSPVASNDNTPGCGSNGTGAVVRSRLTAGTTYFIAVDGQGASAAGDFSLRASQAPANDDIAQATTIEAGTTQTVSSTAGAGLEAAEPSHGGPGGASVWFKFVAPRTGTIAATTCGASFDTLLAIYAGSPGALTQLAADDNGGGCGNRSRATATVTKGETYYIAVDGVNGATGYLPLTLDPAANDHFADAQLLVGRPVAATGTMAGATSEPGEPQHREGQSASRSIWFRWVAPDTRSVTISTCGSGSFGSGFAVYTGSSLGSLTRRGGAASNCADGSSGAETTVAVTGGVEYRIALDDSGGSSSYRLRIDPPANDDFGRAEDLGALETATATGSNLGATGQPNETASGSGPVRSVWYRWTAPRTDAVVVGTCDSSVATAVRAYYEWGYSSPVSPAAEPPGCPAGSLGTKIRFDANAGQTYAFAVDSAGEAAGSFTIDVDQTGDFDPPQTTVRAPAFYQATRNVTIEFAADEPATFECVVDSAPAGPCSSPLELTDLAEGAHQVAIIATDTAGNEEPFPATTSFHVDTIAPQTTVAAAPSAPVSSVSFWFSANETVSRYRCLLDGAPVSCGSGYSPTLPSGTYTLSVAAVDRAGNEDPTPEVRTFTIDRDPPALTITYPAEDGETVNGPALSVEFAVEEGAETFCELDGTFFEQCTSPKTYEGLAHGPHTIRILGTDAAGNDLTVSRSFTTDLTPPEPPANDHLAGALELSSARPEHFGTNEDATAEPGEPAHLEAARRSVWFTYTAATSRKVTLATCGSAFDTVLAVYRGDAVASLERVAVADDGECATGTVLRFSAVAGETYRIALDSLGAGRGDYELRLDVPPDNDARRSAAPLADGQVLTGSSLRATAEDAEPARAGRPASRSVWFAVTPSSDGRVVVEACGSGFDTVLAAYDGDNEVAASEDATDVCGAGSTRSAVAFSGQAGRTYHVALDGDGGDYRVRAMLNDDRSAPAPLSGNDRVERDTTGATAEAGEPAHAASATGSVWFHLQDVEAGRTVTLDTCDVPVGGLDTVLAAYELQGSSLVPIASDDDGAVCGAGGSRLDFVAPAGPVLVAVSGKGGATGRFALRSTSAPANDDRAAARVIAPDAVAFSGSTVAASREAGEPAHAGVPGGRSVWFRWTPGVTGPVELDLCGATFATLLGVYRAGAAGALEEVAFDASKPDGERLDQPQDYSGLYPPPTGCGRRVGSRIGFEVVAGQELLIAVDGRDGAAGSFTGQIRRAPANDAFADAVVLTEDAPVHRVSTRLAGVEAGEPEGHSASAWYRFTAGEDRFVTVTACGAYAGLAVFQGTALGDLEEVTRASGPCGAGAVRFDARAGVTYAIALDGYAAGELEVRLDGPENDHQWSPRALSRRTTGSTAGATKEQGEAAHAGHTGGHSVWFVPPPAGPPAVAGLSPGRLVVASCDSAFDTVLAAYGAGGAALAAGDDAPECGTSGSLLRVASGQVDRIALDGKDGQSGRYRLEVLTNDDRAGAEFLPLSETVVRSNRLASAEQGEPQLQGQTEAHTVWFLVEPPRVGSPVTIDTCGAATGDFDTVLGVFGGTGTTPLATSDDAAGCGPDGHGSRVTVTAGSAPLLVAVDGRAGARGTFALRAVAAPGNDDRAGARAVSDEQIRGTLALATAEPEEPAHGGRPAARSVWFSWTAGTSGPATFDLCDAPFNSVIGVYTASGAALAQVAANDDAVGCGTGSRVTFPAVKGTTYLIAVDSPDDLAAGFTLRRTSAPANDAFEEAEVLAPALDPQAWRTVMGTTRGATSEAFEPAHAGSAATRSVWYRVDVPPGPRTLAVSTCRGSTTPTSVAVYRGDALGGLTHVASGATGDPDCLGGSYAAWFRPVATATETYWVAVDSGPQDASFVLDVLPGEAHDARDAAQEIWLSLGRGSAVGDTRFASLEPAEADHAGAGGIASLWYRFTAPADGPVRVSTCRPGFDNGTGTSMAIYDDGTEVASARGSDACGGGAETTFSATAGRTYMIAVASPASGRGWFWLELAMEPENDDRADATPIAADQRAVTGRSDGATQEAGEPDHAGIAGGASVWYRWTAPRTGPVAIDTCSAGFDTLLGVYTENGDGLQEVASGDDEPGCGAQATIGKGSRARFTAEGGRTYLIAVDGRAGAGGWFELRLPAVNDAFTGAIPVTLPGAAEDELAGFTAEDGEPGHAGSVASTSAWYTLTPPRHGLVTLDTCGFPSTRLSAYRGTSLASLTAVATEDAPGCGERGGEMMRFYGTSGKVYRVAVDSTGPRPPRFRLSARIAAANDLLAGAEQLTSGQLRSGTTHDAGVEAGEPEHADADGTSSVWYRWTPTYRATATIDTCAHSDAATALAVYADGGSGVAGLAPLAESRPGETCGEGGRGSRVRFRGDPAITYLVAVVGRGGAEAAFDLRAMLGPRNDELSGALAISGATFGSTSFAGREPGEADHAQAGGEASVWYRWTAPHAAQVRVDTCTDPQFASAVAVYRQAGTGHAGLVPITTSFGGDTCGAGDRGVRVRFPAVKDVTYLVAVDGRGAARGDFRLTLEHGPANDNLGAATFVAGAGGTLSGHNREATREAAEPDHAGANGTASVWYRWTAPYDTRAVLDTCDSGFDTALAAYTGATAAPADLQSLGSNDDAADCGTGGSRMAFDASLGTTYWIAVDGRDGATGAFNLSLRIAPRNDAMSRAALAPLATPITQRTTGATSEAGEPVHGGPGGASVWYRFTAARTGTLAISTCGSDYDTLLAVYSGVPGMFSQLAANDQDARCGGGASRVTFAAIAGSEYHVAIDGRDGATGTLTLTIDPPTNDDFEDAEVLPGRPASAAGSTIAATRQSGDPAFGGPTVWYRWTATETRSVEVSTCGSDVPASLALFSGSALGSLTQVGSPSGGCTGGARVALAAAAGTTYSFLVATPTDKRGGVQIHVDAPANDDFANAEALASAMETAATGTTAGAGREPGEPAHGPGPRVRSVWFKWVAPVTAPVTVDACGSDSPAVVRAYRGGFTSPEQQVAGECAAGAGSATTFVATAGLEYRFAVDAATTAAGPFELHLLQEVDLGPPVTTVSERPDSPTRAESVEFRFSADETATFVCSVDGAGEEPCASPLTIGGLEEGEHTLRIRAIDRSGNEETPGITETFVIDRTPPDTVIAGEPDQVVHSGSPQFEISGGELLSDISCTLDGKPWACGNLDATGLDVGEHVLRATATDYAGNVDPTPAEARFTVVNEAPDASTSVGPPEGVAPHEVEVTIEASDADDDLLGYRVDWGDGETSSGAHPADEPLVHTYATHGVYAVTVTVTDPWVERTTTEIVVVARGEALSAEAGDDQVSHAGEAVAFDGGGSRPLAGITRYAWSFGDGSVAEGRTVQHTYAEPGTYTARLTVTRGTESVSDTARIEVAAPVSTGLSVSAFSGGVAVPGADVTIVDPDGRRFSAITAANGVAVLRGVPDGAHTVYVDKSGYVPEAVQATVSGGNGNVIADLESGQVAVASLTHRPATLAEIEAAGVDVNDPANQNVVHFEAMIAIGSGSVPIRGLISRGGFWGTSIGGEECLRSGCRVRLSWGIGWITPGSVDIDGRSEPMLTTLVIPFKASWLKEFFHVSMTVTNLAGDGFTLRDGRATFQPPPGLTLAPTSTPQSPTKVVPDIPSKQSRTVSWMVRGDAEGEYDLSAAYAGRLDPVGRSVNILARSAQPLKVWGGSAIHFTVDVDEQVRDGHPMSVRVGMKNVADVPIYNGRIELLKEGRVGYIEQPRQQRAFGTAEIEPGDTFWTGDFVLVPEATGTVSLKDSFVRKVSGNVSLNATVTTHERVPPLDEDPGISAHGRQDSVVVEFEEIPGADAYEVYVSPDRQTDFGDEPLPARALASARPGMNKLLVAADPAATQVFGVSVLEGGKRRLRHPVVTAQAHDEERFPQVFIEGPCRADQGYVYATIADLDIALDRWQYRLGDGPWIDGDPISGEDQVNMWIGLPDPPPAPPVLEVRAANAEQAAAGATVWGPTAVCRIVDRDRLGYSFENRGMSNFASAAGIEQGEILTDAVVKATFSDLDPGYGPAYSNALAALWSSMDDGSCFGLALSGARFDAGIDRIFDTAAGRANTEWNVGDESLLPKPDRLLSRDRPEYTKELLRLLAGTFIAQFDVDYRASINEQAMSLRESADAGRVLRERLEKAMSQGIDPGSDRDGPSGTGLALIALFEGDKGHAVVARAIEDRGDGGYFIDVWDNNHPNETKRIEVEPDGTWSYPAAGWGGSPKDGDFVLASPLFAPKSLRYLGSEGFANASVAVADIAAGTTVDAGDGPEPLVLPVPAGPEGLPSTSSAVFEAGSGSLTLRGDVPSAIFRGNGTMLMVERSGGVGALDVTFDTSAGSVEVAGGPAKLLVMRDGATHEADGASGLTVDAEGKVTEVPYDVGTGGGAPPGGGGTDPAATPVPAGPSGPAAPPSGGGTLPPAQPAFGRIVAPKSIKASLLRRGLKVSVRGARKGAALRVRVYAMKKRRRGRALKTVRATATGAAAQTIKVKLPRAVVRRLARKRIQVEVVGVAAGATPATRTAVVRVR